MKLLASLASPYTRKVRVVLAEKKIECELELVDVNPVDNPVNAANPLGKTDVVDVRVGQRNGAHVREGAAHRGELLLQLSPVAGSARVDDRDLAALLDQIRIDDASADAMDALGDLHRRPAVVFRGKSSTATRWPAANRAINQPDLSMP